MTTDLANDRIRDFMASVAALGDLAKNYMEELETLHRRAEAFDKIAEIVGRIDADEAYGKIAAVVQEVAEPVSKNLT